MTKITNIIIVMILFVSEGCSLIESLEYKAMVKEAHQVHKIKEKRVDDDNFKKLRQDYIEAAKSNDATKLSRFYTDDCVFLQSAKIGPDTYGKEGFIRYRNLLDSVIELKVEPIRVIKFNNTWGLEIGREYTTWKGEDKKEYETLGRYFKILYKDPNKGWKYARTAMIWALGSEEQLPDRNPFYVEGNFIPDYFGYGKWKPREMDSKLFMEIYNGVNENGVQRMIRDGNTMDVMLDKNNSALAIHDKRTTGIIGFFAEGEVLSKEEYLRDRKLSVEPEFDIFPHDHVLSQYHDKGITEIIQVDSDIVFYFGKSIEHWPEAYRRNKYSRTFTVSDHLYFMKKEEDDKWRILYGIYMEEE